LNNIGEKICQLELKISELMLNRNPINQLVIPEDPDQTLVKEPSLIFE
jgi:hypothetical protein